MVIINHLTESERTTLDEARRLLGHTLSNFLLSGLGETTITHQRIFTAQTMSGQDDEITYHLKMINDSERGLPIGRDPLVLATLLDLLWERQPLDSTILFRESDILEKLGWPRNIEYQKLIRTALERYTLTAYCLVDPTHAEEGSVSGRFVSIGRLLIGYEMSSPLYPLKRRGQLKYTASEAMFACAHFLPGLIHDIISERKNFLSIDFQRLQKIQPQTTFR
ncbi:MAG: hypothetical protein WCB68_15615 [Pyrinomonadaceae bacterium]